MDWTMPTQVVGGRGHPLLLSPPLRFQCRSHPETPSQTHSGILLHQDTGFTFMGVGGALQTSSLEAGLKSSF